MSSKCAFVALPSSDVSGGLLCTTCGETFEKEPICPKQRQTMTTNKPEILGYCVKRDREPWERSNNYYLSPNPDDNYTVPVIRLSDYEALQAECEKLVKSLREIAAWPDGGSAYGQEKIKAFASATLEAHRKGVKT